MTEEENLQNLVNYRKSDLKTNLLAYFVSVLLNLINIYNLWTVGGILYQLAFAVTMPISIVIGYRHEQLKLKLRAAQFLLFHRERENKK